jgi:hypothetical protein
VGTHGPQHIPKEMQDRISEWMRWAPKKCQKRCWIEWQNAQVERHTEAQNTCQTGSPKECQIGLSDGKSDKMSQNMADRKAENVRYNARVNVWNRLTVNMLPYLAEQIKCQKGCQAEKRAACRMKCLQTQRRSNSNEDIAACGERRNSKFQIRKLPMWDIQTSCLPGKYVPSGCKMTNRKYMLLSLGYDFHPF